MPKPLNTTIFIEKAILVHGNKYSYANSVYVKSTNKITITCKLHGDFYQVPKDHLMGRGCDKCGGSATGTTETFISKARAVHGNDYEYSNVKYVKTHQKVHIDCKIHGSFYQTPLNHLQGNGCKKCTLMGRVKSVSNEEVDNQLLTRNIKRLGNVQGVGTRIRWQCLKCQRTWFATPTSIIHAKTGCSKCSGVLRLTNEEIDFRIKDRQLVRVDSVVNTMTKIKWKCLVCNNVWLATPNNVVTHGTGCPNCISCISTAETEWLDYVGLPNATTHRQISIQCGNKKFLVDGFDPNTNTIYEFLGDYWHGNPNVYLPNSINKTNHTTFGKLFNKTQQRKQTILNAGYNLIEMWEYDWKLLKQQHKGITI